MQVQLRIHELDEVVEGEQLGAHAGLVTEEISFLRTSGLSHGVGKGVAYHAVHELDKRPKRHGVVLHHCVDGSKKIAHALDVTEFPVVLVIRQKHVFHLLEMNVGARFRERRIGVRMRYVFSFEKGDMAISAMDIFLYMSDPKQWDMSVFGPRKESGMETTYLFCLFALSTNLPPPEYHSHQPFVPTKHLSAE